MSRKGILWLWFALLLAVALKAALLMAQVVPFNSDEAVVALMARHITQGERPIFFYGQAYMGSLDAFLVAGGFHLFGEHVWVIRAVQTALYLGTIFTTVLLGRQLLGSWETGLLAAFLMAVPTVNVTLYTTVSLGGYGEALLLGNLMLLVGGKFLHAGGPSGKAAFGWSAVLGFLIGLGVWAFGLSLVYALPAALALVVGGGRWTVADGRQTTDNGLRSTVYGLRSTLIGLLLGALAGAFPIWIFAAQHGFGVLLREFGGGAIAGVVPAAWWMQPFLHLFNLLLLGSTVTMGLRPPWEVRWLALPLLPLVMGLWLMAFTHGVRRLGRNAPHRRQYAMLLGAGIMLAVLFVLTPFGVDPSGRYFLPLLVPMSLVASDMFLSWRAYIGRWVFAFAALLMVYNLIGTWQSARTFPPGLTTQFDAIAQVDHRSLPDLMAFLQAHGERRGYTNYWVAYPLAFHSQEALIFVPRLPYHEDFRYTSRDDRYPPYDALVAEAERAAYITTHHPALDARLREYFAAQGATWQETQIGDYHVFYALSKKVAPPVWDR
ncbi:MAG: hypothetical protein Fur0018_12870 [Anaerolineales bacterium]